MQVEPSRVVPEVRFCCELPAALPERGDDALRVRPDARLIDDPAVLGAGAARVLAPGPWLTFVPPGGARDHLWLEAASAKQVRELLTGLLSVRDLDPMLRARLRAVGVLGPSVTGRERERAIAAAAQHYFADREYVPVRRLIPAHRLVALRRYYGALVRQGRARPGDAHVESRHAMHREPLTGAFHADLVPVVARLTGEAWKPSYSHFASYLPGACVPRHKDREPGQLALLVAVDASPLPGGSTWPFHLEDERGRVATLRLEAGDGLIFRGDRLAHWREPLPAGCSWDSLLLSFVPETNTGSLD